MKRLHENEALFEEIVDKDFYKDDYNKVTKT